MMGDGRSKNGNQLALNTFKGALPVEAWHQEPAGI
jgi:hypothetical protein